MIAALILVGIVAIAYGVWREFRAIDKALTIKMPDDKYIADLGDRINLVLAIFVLSAIIGGVIQ